MPACRPSPSSGCAPTPTLGLLAVIFLIGIVIASDTAGFLAGRLLGGPKLWPRVSPNKTWAGFVGALVASSIVGALFWFAVPDGSAVRLAAAGAMLSFVAQAGDLAEFGHQAPLRRQGYECADPRAMAASWIASTAWWRRRPRSGSPASSSTCTRPRMRSCSGLED